MITNSSSIPSAQQHFTGSHQQPIEPIQSHLLRLHFRVLDSSIDILLVIDEEGMNVGDVEVS